MAKDNDKGLYLPLKINLSEWEKDLATAGADLQKAMREMRAGMNDLKLRYDVEIAGAKAAGDQLKVLELESKKLTAIYEAQKQAVDALNRAYQQSVKEKGENAKASQDLAKQLVREIKQLDRIKAQMDGKSVNFGKGLSDGLASISPQFASIRTQVASVTTQLSGMGTTAKAVATAISGVGLAAGGIVAAFTGAKAVSDGMRNMAEEAAQASESVFMLAERLNISYKEAEKLDAVFTLDGTSAEGFINAVQKLNKQLLTAGEEGNLASNMLKKFNVELRNGDMTQKTYLEQLKALADGYKRAKEQGQGLDFITATLGSGGNQFVHLLNGLDDYIAKTEDLTRAQKTNYDLNHELLTVNGQLVLQQKELAKATGGAFGNEALSAKQQELEYLKERTRLVNENSAMYKQFAKDMKEVNRIVIQLQGEIQLWMDKLTAAGASLTRYIDKDVMLGFNRSVTDGMVQLIKNVVTGKKRIVEELDTIEPEERAMQQQEQKQQQQQTQPPTKKDDQEAKKKQQELERQLEKEKQVRERFNKELRDATATEYEREINALQDKLQAYMKEGIDEVEAKKLYTIQKEQIDKKYFDKLQQERQKQVKDAEQAYRKEIEEAKKAREAKMSEAEQTLRTNLKLAKYIQREQKAGTYSDEKARNYAEQLYLRQNGYKREDISWLQDFTVPRLKEIANARDRLFSGFAQPQQTTNNNTISISFDNTVVEDLSTMDKLANKVAEVITPAIETALKGGAQYGY